MKFSIIAALITSVMSLTLISLPFENAQATNTKEQTQTGVLVGYGGRLFGLVHISTNGHTTEVNIASDFLPPPGKIFEAWLVDGGGGASGYPLSLGQLFKSGTLKFNEHMVNAYTYTDLIVTLEPANDLDPGGAWSQTVAAYLLASPFGK
jgi:Anti-sigma-K factor rskA, C-terminal